MAEYIEREKLLRAMICDDNGGMSLFQAGIAAAKAVVNSAPAADVAPVVRGRWDFVGVISGHDCWVCSMCGRMIKTSIANPIERFPYCHCGAKMDLMEDV